MRILICLGSHLLGQALQHVVTEQNPEDEVVVAQELLDPAFFAADVVLFDESQRNSDLFTQFPDSKRLFIDSGLDLTDIHYLLCCANVDGILSPAMDAGMLPRALHSVQEGQIWVDQKNLKSILRKDRSFPGKNSLATLGEQDRTIVDWIVLGLRNREIAAKLFLSEQTIKAHVSRIFKKLGVNNRAQLASLAMKHRSALNTPPSPSEH